MQNLGEKKQTKHFVKKFHYFKKLMIYKMLFDFNVNAEHL